MWPCSSLIQCTIGKSWLSIDICLTILKIFFFPSSFSTRSALSFLFSSLTFQKAWRDFFSLLQALASNLSLYQILYQHRFSYTAWSSSEFHHHVSFLLRNLLVYPQFFSAASTHVFLSGNNSLKLRINFIINSSANIVSFTISCVSCSTMYFFSPCLLFRHIRVKYRVHRVCIVVFNKITFSFTLLRWEGKSAL